MNKLESLINCNICRSKKVKCNRELPTCSYCSERSIMCIYPDQIKRRGVSEAGLTSFITKIKVNSNIISRKRSSVNSPKWISKGGEINETQVCKFVLFQQIPQPINYEDRNSPQDMVTKINSNGTLKFQTHILLMLSAQIIDYDSKLIPQIDFFLSKLEFGVFGRLLKFSIHMNQEWIIELFSPSFEEKCITGYFESFHPMVTYLSKYKFYTNNIICPVLKSVIILAGYSSVSKQNPELLKYLKHLAIVQLKKNMFNIRLTVCQSMFIFSYYLLFYGLGKQSLEYFHQAYLMASALGIDKEMPGLNEIDKDERRWVRFTSFNHDSHLSSILNIQPHYLFLAPSWKPLNPLYQTNPYSKDPNEFLISECNCLSKKCYIMYWTISANLMNKYSQLTLTNPQTFLKDNSNRVICLLQNLFNYSLIQTLDLHLSLSNKCKNPEELEIVKNFAKMYVGIYHDLKIILNSQFSPENPMLGLDQSTKKQLWSAEALYRITTDVNPLCLPMFYHYLCSISLLYIKLILTYNHVPHAKELFLGKLRQVYELFKDYRTKYNMPSDLIDVVDIITTYYNIKVR